MASPFPNQQLAEKRLLNFANVATERRALYREALLQHLARGRGVVPVLSQGLDPILPLTLPTREFQSFRRHYIPGRTLREFLGDRPLESTARIDHARLIMAQLGDALERLHHLKSEQGHDLSLIHRDLSPANVLLEEHSDTKSGKTPEVWINDFGIAHLKAWGPLDEDETLQGTPRFLSPELRRGEQPTVASDIFQAALLLALLLLDPPARSALSVSSSLSLAQDAINTLGLRDALDDYPQARPSAREFSQLLRA